MLVLTPLAGETQRLGISRADELVHEGGELRVRRWLNGDETIRGSAVMHQPLGDLSPGPRGRTRGLAGRALRPMS
ncbi:DUF5597 domain-containing protein [Microbacterium esteraromaticum]|nr:DUF5597 domain-containing protein [Microbacterium esteraromaticum]